MTTLTRRYRFSASHRLHSSELSSAENKRLYGKCNNPFGHGHDYVLEVTVAGKIDPSTGLILPAAQLDRLVEEKVVQLFAFRNINLDIPRFSRLVPTTENIVLVIAELLQENWRGYVRNSSARLHRIHLQETDRNGFELFLGATPAAAGKLRQLEDVTINA